MWARRFLADSLKVSLSRHARDRSLYFISLPFSKGLTHVKTRGMSTDSRPHIYVTRKVPERGVELLRQGCRVTQWDQDDPVPRDVLLRNIKGVDALFCLLTDKIDKEIIDEAGAWFLFIGVSDTSTGYIITVSVPVACSP